MKPSNKEILDRMQRLQAEFDNYRKRSEQEKQVIIKQANQELIQRLLIVLDKFEPVFEANKDDKEFSKGVRGIYSQICSILEKAKEDKE